MLIANSFATIVQLLGIFTQERKNIKDLSHRDFIEWLEYHRHEDIKNFIANTAAVQTDVNHLLRQDHAQILDELDNINRNFATLLSRIGDFRGLAATIMPSAGISDQAYHILRQFVDSGSSYFCVIKTMNGNRHLQLERGGHVNYNDLRFIVDDLNQLVSLQLITREIESSGQELYRITRNAVSFCQAIDLKPHSSFD